LMFGFGFQLAYKGVDLSVSFAGAAHTNLDYAGRSTWAFADGNGVYNVLQQYYDGRWIPGADNSKARFPNVTDSKNVNNFTTNTLYQVNGNYLRLKTVEIGYTFSKAFNERLHISNFRLFVNGLNVAIWDHIKIINPEDNSPNENYPLTRNINFGASVSF